MDGGRRLSAMFAGRPEETDNAEVVIAAGVPGNQHRGRVGLAVLMRGVVRPVVRCGGPMMRLVGTHPRAHQTHERWSREAQHDDERREHTNAHDLPSPV